MVRRAVSALCLAGLLTGPALLAHALSDSEYTGLRAASPAFDQAEKELDAAWKRVRARASKERMPDILQAQRHWNGIKDQLAANLIQSQKRSLAQAHAAVSRARAVQLELFAASLEADGPLVYEGTLEFGHNEAGGFYRLALAGGPDIGIVHVWDTDGVDTFAPLNSLDPGTPLKVTASMELPEWFAREGLRIERP